MSRARVRKYLSSENICLGLILALAAFLRFYRLDSIPPGLNNDEAFNLLDIQNLLHGQFSIFFPANTGREPLWFYLNTASVALLGMNALALRVTAAVIGTLTAGLVYGFTRTLFRSRTTAAVAALFLAISTWHLFSSRYGLRVILATMLVLLALWWFWRGLVSQRSRPWYPFGLAGVCTALALYTHLTSRLLPILLILLTGFAVLVDRSRARRYLAGLLVTGIVALVLCLPLGGYFALHLDDALGHTTNLSIFDPRVNQGNIPLALWNNTVLVAGSFLVRGDHEAYRNVALRPAFDPLIGAFFIIGLAAALVALVARRSPWESRLRAFLLGMWLVTWMMSSITSDDAPNFLRMLPGVCAAVVLAAWGVSAVWGRIRGAAVRRAALAAFGGMMLVSSVAAFRDYFDFGQSGSAYLAFDANVADAAAWVNRNASSAQVYMAPLWAVQGTMRVIGRNVPMKSFESRDTVVLPSNASGKDAFFVFPWEQEKKAQTLASRLGALGAREDLIGSAGFPVALAVRVPSQNLPDAQNPLAALAGGSDFIRPQQTAHAMWADSFELIGYSVQAADSAKRNLEVTVLFHALRPVTQDYTFSVKVRDAKGRVWGQEDKWLGDNSYATTQWSPGDLIIERFYPGLNACAPGGDYTVSIEAYDPRTMQGLALSDANGTTASLGTTHAEASPSNRLEDLEIEQPVQLQVAPQATLLGYTLDPQVRAGGSFSLALFWQGVGDGTQSRRFALRLVDAAKRNFALAEESVLLPPAGRGLCLFKDLTAPGDAADGPASILVNDVKIGAISIAK